MLCIQNCRLISIICQSPLGSQLHPNVGGPGPNLSAANHVVIAQKFCVSHKQRQAFTRVIRLGQNWVPHTWLLLTGPSGYDNRSSDLHLLSAVAHRTVLHALISQSNITTSMMYRKVVYRMDHTKPVKEQGNIVTSKGENEWLLSGQCNQDTALQQWTNTISPTNAIYSTGLENTVLVRSLEELVADRLHFVWVGYSDECEMKSIISRYLVNCNISSFG
jgi:hypothetical protein